MRRRQAVYDTSKKHGRGSVLVVRTQPHTQEEVREISRALEDLFEANGMEVTADGDHAG